ncbi:MAG: EF-hand domain-containing protein [Bradyrhizobium sp.]
MDITGVGAASGMHAVSGASSSGPPQQRMSELFDSIDTSGSGSITQSQFDQAFQTKNPPAVFQKQGADAIFAALDPNGTGSVSKQDFVAGMKQLMASLRAGDAAPAGSSTSQSSASLAASVQSLNVIDKSSLPQTTLQDLKGSPPGALINLQA